MFNGDSKMERVMPNILVLPIKKEMVICMGSIQILL